MNGYLKEVNIKYDMPTADVAVKRAIKFIHGYGSSGAGGKIRIETRRYLGEQKRKGFIRDFIPGESFSIFDEATRQAFWVCDELRRDPDLERSNNGITIVIL